MYQTPPGTLWYTLVHSAPDFRRYQTSSLPSNYYYYYYLYYYYYD